MLNDVFVLTQIKEGNIKAFETLFRQYYTPLCLYAASITGETDVAEEIVEELFYVLWKDREKLKNVRSFSSYLFQMARFTVYDYFDRLIVSEKYTNEYLQDACQAESEEETLFVRELQSIINRTVERMSPQRSKIYRMSREEGLSNDEIAKRLDISKRTVENHLTAALAILRKVLYLFFLLHT